MKFFSPVFAYGLAVLIGLLSLSSISPGLHSSFFHGDEGCPYSLCDKPCGSQEEEEGEEREVPCPVVLFGQFFLGQDYFADLSVSETLVFEIGFFLYLSPLDSCTDEPFGARDPPFLA